MKISYRCRECGSHHLLFEARVLWSEARQDWEVYDVDQDRESDRAHCLHCEREVIWEMRVDEAPVGTGAAP